MSWRARLNAIFRKRQKDQRKKLRKDQKGETWYQQMNNAKAKVKSRNRRRRKLARIQRQRTAR